MLSRAIMCLVLVAGAGSIGALGGTTETRAGGITTTTITTTSATFHVDIHNGHGSLFQTETSLNSTWLRRAPTATRARTGMVCKRPGCLSRRLAADPCGGGVRCRGSKPLFDSLITPAIKAYLRSNPDAGEIAIQNVKITVDEAAVDVGMPAADFVRADGIPPMVTLTLPYTSELVIRHG